MNIWRISNREGYRVYIYIDTVGSGNSNYHVVIRPLSPPPPLWYVFVQQWYIDCPTGSRILLILSNPGHNNTGDAIQIFKTQRNLVNSNQTGIWSSEASVYTTQQDIYNLPSYTKGITQSYWSSAEHSYQPSVVIQVSVEDLLIRDLVLDSLQCTARIQINWNI